MIGLVLAAGRLGSPSFVSGAFAARRSAQFVRCSGCCIEGVTICGNKMNSSVKRTNHEGPLHTFLP